MHHEIHAQKKNVFGGMHMEKGTTLKLTAVGVCVIPELKSDKHERLIQGYLPISHIWLLMVIKMSSLMPMMVTL